MDAKTLITAVQNEKLNGWENSNLYDTVQILLEEIAAHYEHCEECRDAFDAMDYDEGTLKDMEIRFFQDMNLDHWTCMDAE